MNPKQMIKLYLAAISAVIVPLVTTIIIAFVFGVELTKLNDFTAAALAGAVAGVTFSSIIKFVVAEARRIIIYVKSTSAKTDAGWEPDARPTVFGKA